MESCIQFQAFPAVRIHDSYRRFPPTSNRRSQLNLQLKKPYSWESRRSRTVAISNGRLTTPVTESENNPFDESVITEEEMSAIGKMRGKCNGVNGGIAELLECLEKEAIMGEDDGKEPDDYSRRALIFDKSSKVFQALKDGGCTTTTLPV